MTTIHLQGTVDTHGRMRLDVPCNVPPGTVDVVVVIASSAESKSPIRLADFYGTCKEAWEGIDAQEYVDQLRNEWER